MKNHRATWLHGRRGTSIPAGIATDEERMLYHLGHHSDAFGDEEGFVPDELYGPIWRVQYGKSLEQYSALLLTLMKAGYVEVCVQIRYPLGVGAVPTTVVRVTELGMHRMNGNGSMRGG